MRMVAAACRCAGMLRQGLADQRSMRICSTRAPAELAACARGGCGGLQQSADRAGYILNNVVCRRCLGLCLQQSGFLQIDYGDREKTHISLISALFS